MGFSSLELVRLRISGIWVFKGFPLGGVEFASVGVLGVEDIVMERS